MSLSLWTPAFPSLVPCLLFGTFATLVVHVCHRLVEHTSFSLDPRSRRMSGSMAGYGIGCLVWALDVVGFAMYPGLTLDEPALPQALGALLLMVLAARLSVPVLGTSMQLGRLLVHGFVLATGTLAAHFILAWGYGAPLDRINWVALGASLLLATGIAGFCSMRHRRAKLRAVDGDYVSQPWSDKAACGAAIVVLHWLLVCSVPMLPLAGARAERNIALLVVVVVFATLVALEHLGNLRVDRRRQVQLREGLSLMRMAAGNHAAGQDATLSLITAQLPQLMQPHRLVLHFQPIVDQEHAERAHCEALLRIEDPVLGRLNPETFFLVCDLQGKTAEVDRLILVNALQTMAGWQRQGYAMPCVSVNVAPVTLTEPGFAPWLLERLHAHGVPPEALVLELTEHAIIVGGAQMLEVLQALGGIGVAVVMDDFGAGYSSLAVLGELPIRGIKCDRLFMRGLETDGKRQVLLQHIHAVAQALSLGVTLEGIETADELALVRRLGFRRFQGYHFSRPIPAPALAQGWLRPAQAAQPQALQV